MDELYMKKQSFEYNDGMSDFKELDARFCVNDFEFKEEVESKHLDKQPEDNKRDENLTMHTKTTESDNLTWKMCPDIYFSWLVSLTL